MPFVRLVRSWFAWAVLLLVVFGPIVALCAASILDRGPEGGARASIFSVAITALDPFIWTCTRNSLIAAGATACGSMAVGVYIGRLIGDWRFPARPILLAALTASAVAPPAVVALGLSVVFGTDGSPIRWVDRLGPIGRFVPADWGWYAWFWSALVQGGSITALACLSALQRLDPAWRDAARLVGGTRGRVWRKLNWPLLRPALARAVGLVFVLTVADPGAPMILGLRRTLGYQIIVIGLGDEPFPRIAVLGLIAVLSCVVVRVALNGWAGPESSFREISGRPLRTGSWRRGTLGTLVAGLWLAYAGLPILALLLESIRNESSVGVKAFAGRLLDPTVTMVLVSSAWLGTCVCVFFAISGWLARSLPSPTTSATSNRILTLLHAGFAPPLALGVAALCLPRLAGLAVAAFDGGSPHGLVSLFRQLAALLSSDPFRLLLPAAGVWLAMTPTLIAAWEGGYGTEQAREDRIGAAMLGGAGWTRAHRLANARSRTDALRRVALTSCLAATNFAPALLLANRAENRTLGPAVLLLREDPEFGLGPASALAFAAFAVNVAVVFSCSPTRLASGLGPGGPPKSA